MACPVLKVLMPTRLPLHGTIAVSIALVAGCATMPSEVAVPIDTAQIVGRTADAPRRAQVQVTDIRKEATLERTTIGGVSLGKIDLKPPVPDLVRAVVQAKADEVVARQGIADPQTVLCGIRVFDITTPATAVYWDINTKVEIILRVRGQDRTVTASATDRTFVWPSEELIGRVTTEALKHLAAESERALTGLFAAR
jgi:uncharacterized lipoprotein YajG